MDLARELTEILAPERVLSRRIDRIAWANDASVYRLVPRVVVQPESIDEVRELLRFSRRRGIPLTFRASGTSLSGQSVTDGILVVVSRHWREIEVLRGGKSVRVQPGAIGGMVNRRLKPHGSKIGPDPASIDACAMGGILANNSSGMCCGVVHNAYHTLESMAFVLPDGLTLDTADPGAREKLAREAPRLVRGLTELRERILRDDGLCARIRSKYRLKNTMGYSINAFVDHREPLDILARLMIGSEGTLGFIAHAVLSTIPDHPLKYTGLLFFADVPRACASIEALRDSGAAALELMDRASLRSVEDRPGVPAPIRDLPDTAAAILVEYQCGTEEELLRRRSACDDLLPKLPLIERPTFTRDLEEQALLWRVRKGIIPSVGAMRARGTSCIIEDVVFPLEHLAPGVAELQRLCAAYGYHDAIVFGHAKDGNLHFVVNQAFDEDAAVARYDRFMQELAQLVAVRCGGALKAEHGTGRNMAPFVETEWGADAYRVMRDLKRLIDPDGLLNPGVILNDDPRAHVKDLKSLPTVEPEVDHCIECGFCEPVCPSRDLTLTPRQRIVVRREMARLAGGAGDAGALAELEADYLYDGLATCATDGLCATVCPVSIDTGRLVKRLRRGSRSDAAHEAAWLVARRFSLVEPLARLALRVGRLVRRDLPPAARGLPATGREGVAAVYFPSCVSRIVGADERCGRSVTQLFVEVASRAGLPLWLPPDLPGHCCGLPFSSKGYDRASRHALNRSVDSLWRWTGGGRLPVVVDSSPCTHTLRQGSTELHPRNRERLGRMRILDGIEFAHDEVLGRCRPRKVGGRVVLHPVCSVRRMGLEGKLLRVAEACADAAEVPLAAGCCGFAGDRGFSHPELTRAATRLEALEVLEGGYGGFYATSRTCEIALSRATGRPYLHLWSLLERATRAPSGPPAEADGGAARR